MTVAVLALSLTITALAAALLTGGAWARRTLAATRAELDSLRAERDASGFRVLVGQRVIANVIDGGAISGVLSHVYVDSIVLAHPEYVAGSKPVGIGAEMTISRSRVPTLQRFDADAPVALAAVAEA